MKHQVLGTLVGNTGEPHNLQMVLNSSFSGRRGEFVRIRHQEHQGPRVNAGTGRGRPSRALRSQKRRAQLAGDQRCGLP